MLLQYVADFLEVRTGSDLVSHCFRQHSRTFEGLCREIHCLMIYMLDMVACTIIFMLEEF